MKRFLTTYLLTAGIGTATVYYGTPMIAAKLPRLTNPAFAITGPSVDDLTPSSVAFARMSPVTDASSADPDDSSPGNGTRSIEGDDAPINAPPEAPIIEPPPVIPPYQPPASSTNASSWAILIQRAVHYSTGGKNLGMLPAGTFGEVIKTTTSSDGDVAVCTIDQDGQWKGPVLIGVANLVVFEGPFTTVSADTLGLLRHYYALKERIDARTAAIQQAITAANPHAAAYVRATDAVNEFVLRAKKMSATFKDATGPARSEMLDQLKRMKFEQVRLNSELSQAEARMKEWTANNPDSPTNAASDPELSGWLAELRRIEPLKQAIIP
ncbi:MAG: hypothetical protein FJ222_02550 [Lentisphaerae bacterium]|nr:hypothetical protein [Lentisphaerota bacterium]